jgi:hypothetical protein
MDPRLSSPATQRNRGPILDVLRRILPQSGTVLEIASGAGEHAIWFAQHFPHLAFQPSDPDPSHRASIAAWTATTGVTNVRPPLALDTTDPDWDANARIPRDLSAMLCINMIHIAPWSATLGLMRGAGKLLGPEHVLYLYGAYKREGRHTSPSNAAFDADLSARDPSWGVRDLEIVAEAAAAAGFALDEVVAMPANNLSVIFRKNGTKGQGGKGRVPPFPSPRSSPSQGNSPRA